MNQGKKHGCQHVRLLNLHQQCVCFMSGLFFMHSKSSKSVLEQSFENEIEMDLLSPESSQNHVLSVK